MNTKSTAPVKTIALLGSSEGRRAALQHILSSRYPHADFKPVTKLSEAPVGCSIASIGFPGFLNPSVPTEVIVVNTRFVQDPQAREAQRTLLANKETTAEQLIGELTDAEPVVVIPSRVMDRIYSDIAEARSNYLEVKGDGEDAAAIKKAEDTLMATYKNAFASLRATGMIAPVPAEEKKPEEAAADLSQDEETVADPADAV